MRQWIEENKRFLLPVGMIILIIIPIIIYGLSAIPLLPGCNNDWVGFWGGYLGAIIGGVITLYVLVVTIKDNKDARNRDEKSNYFKDVIELIAQVSTEADASVLLLINTEKNIIDTQAWHKILDIQKDIDVVKIMLLIKRNNKIFIDIKKLEDAMNKFESAFKSILDIPLKNMEKESSGGKIYEIDKKIIQTFSDASTDLRKTLIDVCKENYDV